MQSHSTEEILANTALWGCDPTQTDGLSEVVNTIITQCEKQGLAQVVQSLSLKIKQYSRNPRRANVPAGGFLYRVVVDKYYSTGTNTISFSALQPLLELPCPI